MVVESVVFIGVIFRLRLVLMMVVMFVLGLVFMLMFNGVGVEI